MSPPHTDGLSAAQRADAAATYLRGVVNTPPRLAVILGSGLGDITNRVTSPLAVSFASVPYLLAPTVPGHDGLIVFGLLGGQPAAVLRGRVHPYEGHSPSAAAFPVRVLRRLGVQVLIVTNAAGSLHPSLPAGTLLVISDHVSLPSLGGNNPLIGWDGDASFVDMVDAYDPHLRQVVREVGVSLGMDLPEGVYAMVGGPSFETPAEVEALRRLGADVVGMSTAHEVIVARQEGLRVLGLSVITNAAAHPGVHESHEQVLAAAERARANVERLLLALMARLD